ncbi:MAG: hypothetical protein ACRD12_05880 [Acidimicrobiales bacterium]
MPDLRRWLVVTAVAFVAFAPPIVVLGLIHDARESGRRAALEEYAAAIVRGDAQHVYYGLCRARRARTSPEEVAEELRREADRLGGVEGFCFTRGMVVFYGPEGEDRRTIRSSREAGEWRQCPARSAIGD